MPVCYIQTLPYSTFISLLYISAITLTGNVASAKPTLASTCPTHFLAGKAPTYLTNQGKLKLSKLLITPLCKTAYSVGYSHSWRTPFWSAEHLTRENLKLADKLERKGLFYEEDSLPKHSKVLITELRKKGYDKGHLAPSHDMPSFSAQFESFSLANIALQHRWHNQKLWANVERLTRYQVYQHQQAYVVTGVAFINAKNTGKPKHKNQHGIPIPSHFYKAVYIPSLNQAGVYWSKNDASGHIQIISLAALAQKTGVDVMPTLPEKVKTHRLQLAWDVYNPNIKNTQSSKDTKENHTIDIHLWLQKLVQFIMEVATMLKSLFI